MAMQFEDVHLRIRVEQFWRGLLGDVDYNDYDSDDLQRWYFALETRTPEEIREVLTERAGRRNPTHFLGLVAQAPHPPLFLVQLWLETHEHKSRMAPYWYGFAAFMLLATILGPNLMGCQNLPTSSDPLASKPGTTSPRLAAGQGGTPPPPMPFQGAPQLPASSNMAPDHSPQVGATPAH